MVQKVRSSASIARRIMSRGDLQTAGRNDSDTSTGLATDGQQQSAGEYRPTAPNGSVYRPANSTNLWGGVGVNDNAVRGTAGEIAKWVQRAAMHTGRGRDVYPHTVRCSRGKWQGVRRYSAQAPLANISQYEKLRPRADRTGRRHRAWASSIGETRNRH